MSGDERDGTLDPVFHSGGNLLTATTESGDVLVADIGNPRQSHVAAKISDLKEKLATLSFSPDGHLAVIARGTTAQIWDLASLPALSANPIGMACKLAGQGFNRETGAKYAPGLPYRDSCRGHGTS
ncbi:hypothetical protein [Streptomyces laculatispora]|uniref:hypothetical protein n=1 Tax=Streptomyces laculatispora TaxID=887464 RepID=UPI001A93C427|nr:hypothetical protein [Streptomyces laculatispora]MBO0916723.1 hypothetical protein [Streptomyces laculatispora]